MKDALRMVNIVTACTVFILASWVAAEAFQHRAWIFVALGALGMLNAGQYLEDTIRK